MARNINSIRTSKQAVEDMLELFNDTLKCKWAVVFLAKGCKLVNTATGNSVYAFTSNTHCYETMREFVTDEMARQGLC